jgi:hypothetical protein
MQSQFNNNIVYTIKSKSISTSLNDILENVPFMDAKNISEMICNQYVNHELKCSKTFLKLFLTQIAYIFDHSLHLNRNLDTLYIPSIPKLDEGRDEDLNESFGHYISTNNLSYMEQYLVVQFNHFLTFISEELSEEWNTVYSLFKDIEKYKSNIKLFESNSEMNITSWTDFLLIKIQQPILLINPDLLNEDRRSTRATDYLYSQTNNEDIEFTYEIGKRILPNFDIYSENGFTILEYLIHFLTIRGNPLDRWYTMYCGMNDRSNYKPRKHGYNNVIKFEEKYSKMAQNNKIKDDYVTLYFSFDHGS